MKRLISLALSLALLAMPGVQTFSAFAANNADQQNAKRQISGVITDKSGEPVIGASVMVPKTTIGAVTDENGRYFLEVPAGTTTVEVSCIGYATETITLTAASTYNVTLADDTEMLEETVVVGYGVQKKVNLTGSVSAVSFETVQAKSRPLTNATQALANASPGLQVMQSSGQPNSEGFGMMIRGNGTLNSSSPLVLVDGVEQSISTVNPADIANVSILKDAASCAIYGNRGANGVILVTTKNGSNGKVTIDFDATFSYQEPFKVIHTVSDYATYMELFNESQTNVGLPIQFQQSIIDTWREAKKNPNATAASGYPNYVAYPNTDWWDVIYQKQWQKQYNLSVSGKEKRTGYTFSFGYTDNPGIVANSGYDKFQGRVNIYSDVRDWLRLGTRISGNYTDQAVNAIGFGGLTTTKVLACTYPYYDGKFGAPENVADDPQSHNVLWDFVDVGTDIRTQLFTDWYAEVKFLKHFTYKFDYYYNDYRREKKTVNKSVGKYSFSQGAYTTGADAPNTLYTYMYYTRDNNYQMNHLLTYNQSFGKHDVSALLGYEQRHYVYRVTDVNKLGLTDANINDLNAAATPYSTTGYGTEWASRSYFGRVNYAFANKYLFEANFRYDGSSRFAPEQRWGFFPSASAAWRITQEPFMKNLPAVSDLKLRVSYGELGNNSIGNYDWQSMYNTANYASGDTQVSGIAITAISNRALTWESTSVANVGLDFGFLGNRLTGTVDAYNKLTSGILYTPDMPMSGMGNASAPKQNIAEVTNRGIELELGWRDSIGKDFSYSVKGNVSYNKNWVSKYKGKLNDDKSNIGDVSTGSTTRVLEDHQIGEWYLPNVYKGSGKGYAADGINGGPVDGMIRTESDLDWVKQMQANGYSFQPTNTVDEKHMWYGEYVYADANGDKIYGSSLDYEFQGTSTTPKWNYGFQATAQWKNFDFSMNWGGVAGLSIYYYETGRNGSYTIYGYAIPQAVANDRYFYDPSNPSDPRTNINAKYPRLAYNSSGNSGATSSLHLERGDFLKLRNLTFGYTLPEKLVSKINLQKVRVFATGENLFAFTGFSGQDPEQRTTVAYSTMRQYAFGVNVTF